MTEKQCKCVCTLRAKFIQEFSEFPELNTQWNILRFCRARNFNMAKVELMLRNMFNWRRMQNMRRIASMGRDEFAGIEKIYVSGVYNTDKMGRPILIERLGATDMEEILKDKYKELREDYFIQRIERQIFIQFPTASEKVGQRIDNIFMIMDLKGISVSTMFSSRFKNFLKYLTKFSQDYYPEMLGKMFIVNAPTMIKVIWNMVKFWLDKRTAEKIEIHSNIPVKRLMEYVDMDRLPDFLGGTSSVPLQESPGPWKAELDKSFANKTFFMANRAIEYKHFYLDSDLDIKEQMKNCIGVLDKSLYQLGFGSKYAIELMNKSALRSYKTLTTQSSVLNLDGINDDEAEKFTDARKIEPAFATRSCVFNNTCDL